MPVLDGRIDLGLKRDFEQALTNALAYADAPQNPDGSLGAPVKAGWDLETNKKV